MICSWPYNKREQWNEDHMEYSRNVGFISVRYITAHSVALSIGGSVLHQVCMAVIQQQHKGNQAQAGSVETTCL